MMFPPFEQASNLARIYSKLHVVVIFLHQLPASGTLSDEERALALDMYAELAIEQKSLTSETIAHVEIMRGRLIERLFPDEVVFDFSKDHSRRTVFEHYSAGLVSPRPSPQTEQSRRGFA